MKVFRICVWIWICVSNMCLNNNSCYFHMKMKILADFQICISASGNISDYYKRKLREWFIFISLFKESTAKLYQFTFFPCQGYCDIKLNVILGMAANFHWKKSCGNESWKAVTKKAVINNLLKQYFSKMWINYFNQIFKNKEKINIDHSGRPDDQKFFALMVLFGTWWRPRNNLGITRVSVSLQQGPASTISAIKSTW